MLNLKEAAKPQAWSCLGKRMRVWWNQKHYIKNGLHRWACHFLDQLLTLCCVCAYGVFAPCRTQCAEKELKKGNCHLRLCMEGTWELRRESEVHCVILVLRDSGAGGRNGSSAGQQWLRVQGHGVIKTNAKFKEIGVQTWVRGVGRALGGRGSFLLRKVFDNWSGTREAFQIGGKGGEQMVS